MLCPSARKDCEKSYPLWSAAHTFQPHVLVADAPTSRLHGVGAQGVSHKAKCRGLSPQDVGGVSPELTAAAGMRAANKSGQGPCRQLRHAVCRRGVMHCFRERPHCRPSCFSQKPRSYLRFSSHPSLLTSNPLVSAVGSTFSFIPNLTIALHLYCHYHRLSPGPLLLSQ